MEYHVSLHDGNLTFNFFVDGALTASYSKDDALARYQSLSASEERVALEDALVRTQTIPAQTVAG